MVEKLFSYFASARYDRALKLAEELSSQRFSQRELSFLLLTASFAELFQGKSSQQEGPHKWMGEVLNSLLSEEPKPNPFLTLLMAFEGSKLFMSSPEEGLLMLEQAQKGAQEEAELGGVLFFRAIFEMNRKENYNEVLAILLHSRKLLAGNSEFSLFSFIRFWNEAMIAHVSNQLEQYKECESLTRQVLLHSQNLGFHALKENCYFNLAFAHQGQKDNEQCQHYLEKNIQFWQEKSNPLKLGLAFTMAGVLMIQLEEIEDGLQYLQKRKEMGFPLETHWAMIRSALEETKNPEAAEWVWKD